jgi:hypothetical protein
MPKHHPRRVRGAVPPRVRTTDSLARRELVDEHAESTYVVTLDELAGAGEAQG